MRIAAFALITVMGLGLGPGPAAGQQPPRPTAAKVRGGASAPLAPQLAVGGGEVVLDVTVARDGSVAKVLPIRATPPYTELVTKAVSGWSFDPPKALLKGALLPAEGHVLVVAMYRPPQVYAAPAPGAETKSAGTLASELPAPTTLAMPASYPPNSTRDGTVVVELDVSMAGMVRGAKVIGPASTFDSAALETVRGWRFDIPRNPTGADTIYVYAIVGFREPITQ